MILSVLFDTEFDTLFAATGTDRVREHCAAHHSEQPEGVRCSACDGLAVRLRLRSARADVATLRVALARAEARVGVLADMLAATRE